ncbi:MAG: 23S rRNA (uracil(1939)-C(5))-methyltransferase RlmD [Clostridia bacterium]|nr:23S rRNA (uracil(1939)-C(5))-methyltransferase RlmD [Clostridia bacterium]
MLRKNDIAEIYIDAYGYEGEGIGRIDGVPVFVPFTAKGDKVKVKIVKTASSYMYGIAMEILEHSPHRTIAPCFVFGKCGGCSIMHIEYEKQLELKTERVEDCMRKIGKLPVKVLPCIPSDKVFGYRNKIQIPIGENKEGKPIAGFYAPRSHRIAENTACHLQTNQATEIINGFLKWMEEYKIKAYNEETGKGLVRHLFIRQGETGGNTEIAVMPIINGNNLPFSKELEEILKPLGVTTLCININKNRNNVILGDTLKIVYGSGKIQDRLLDNLFDISPLSFYQVNRPQAEKLYEIAIKNGNFTKDDVIYDLYCGAGTITLSVAKYVKKVYGIEIVQASVDNAKENARKNGIVNAEFLCGDVSKTVKMIMKDNPPDGIILDPPRKGCDKEMLELLKEINSEKIVYISCNPATLARDMAYLFDIGYTAKEVQPVDLFPQTSHVECCVLLCGK